jgi:PKD repeat protein
MQIFRAIAPNPAQAGADMAICSNSTTLVATPAVNGTGTWSQVLGSSNIQNPTQPTTLVTAMVPGTHIYVWSVSNGICPAVTDTVVVQSALSVTQANAGINQTVCTASATLNGNTPNPGLGTWTVGTGTATLVSPNLNNSVLSNVPLGQTYLIWTLRNAGCVSFDTVIINRIAAPVASFTYQQTGYTFTFANTSQNAVSAFWTFGDGNSSSQMNPIHTYQNPANYPVRLIVANACGSDTVLVSISAFGVGTDVTLSAELTAEVWPNPASDVLNVLWTGVFDESAALELYDAKGQKVLIPGISTLNSNGRLWILNTGSLSKGVYNLHLKTNSRHENLRFILK